MTVCRTFLRTRNWFVFNRSINQSQQSTQQSCFDDKLYNVFAGYILWADCWEWRQT